MALKAVHVSDVPNLDQVPENAALALCSTRFSTGVNEHEEKSGYRFDKFVVMGHRGSGMNMLQSADPRMKSTKENSILSFNEAAKYPIDFIEFDVQGVIIEKRVTELTLAEFLSYGPQKENGKEGKRLFRKTKDGRIFEWKVEKDAPFCTLEEAFRNVDQSLGFNIELKFDDKIVYKEEELSHALEAILKVVLENAKGRPIMFSSFHPDAAQLVRKLQSIYPVFFLTNGGCELYADVRRNSLDEAITLCLASGLQGIVSEVRAIFRNPGAVARIKESKLSLITYGQLNNVAEVVYMQHLVGVEGVIVDRVEEITESVSDLSQAKLGEEKGRPQFSKDELSFLLKLIPDYFSLDDIYIIRS
ncbi:Glycerophosphoryl diester phosphodiesterase [Corchorus capsularis]|uniref:glycerophosphodiester phosphodiesterase n=1 Tax=Corchorus capsularis TaxID=210143 RepID=A0A1R3FW83_COCAP|nr:Glycerophosphoryl diester phosphodiesterase [Corchorus capsularis]